MTLAHVVGMVCGSWASEKSKSRVSFPCATAHCLDSHARTTGSSLAMPHCNDSCSCTPGSSLAAALCDNSRSSTPGSSLAAALCNDSRSSTPGCSLVMARLPVSAGCSRSRTTGLPRLCVENEPFFVSLLVYHWKEDSFNHAMLHNNSLSDKTCTM